MSIRTSAAAVALAAFVVSTTGCATTSVRHRAAPELAQTDHKTFRVLHPKVGQSESIGDAVAERLQEGMIERGYALSDNPDVVVSWKVMVEGALISADEAENQAFDQALGAANAGGVDPMAAANAQAAESSAEKLLIVFVQDAETLDVLWVGWAQDRVTKSTLVSRSLTNVEKLIEGLPPRADS